MNCPRSLATIVVIASFLLAQVPFGLAEWMALGSAPEGEGLYDIVIRATYANLSQSFPLKLQVNETNPPSLDLTIEPMYPISRETPVDLKYYIKVGGSTEFILIHSNLTLYYASGQVELSSGAIPLERNESGHWHALINLPLKGEYIAVVSVEAEKGGTIYRGGITTTFSSDTASPDLLFTHSLDKRVLLTGEAFEASAQLSFDGVPITDLSDIRVNMFGTVKGLSWDDATGTYRAEMTAPSREGVYPISVLSEGQGFGASDMIFVADPGGAKSGRCPLAFEELGECSDMKDARKCVYDYKAGAIQVAELDLILCFAQAKFGIEGTLSCAKDAKGDLNGNGRLETEDVWLMQTYITPLVQADQLKYKDCADYDRDGNVDEDDLTCLTNAVSTKWHGTLMGGVCINATYESPLKCDLTGDGFIGFDDEDFLQDLIDAADAGIPSSKQELGACDMNQDGKLDAGDKACIEYFAGLDLDDPLTFLSKDEVIPGECMAIYTLDDCQGIRGDINGDMHIDQVDEILEMLIYKKQIAGYSMACADVNEDSFISLEDVLCVLAYTQGDKDYYYVCIGCDEYTPYAYRNSMEICNDGYDNDCNGLVDRTDVNGTDFCQCSEATPCGYVWDNDGGQIPGVDDMNVRTCRMVSWETPAGKPEEYFWLTPDTFVCSEAISCESVECHGETQWRCSFDGLSWDWRANPDDVDESSDPLNTPKLCEDGYDNDCVCGDQECDESESPSMFGAWEFWVMAVVGAILGAVLTILLDGLGLLIVAIISVLLSGAGMFIDDPVTKSLMTGFSLGLAVGSLGGGIATAAGAGTVTVSTAGTTAQQAAQTALNAGTATFGQSLAAVAPTALANLLNIASVGGLAALTATLMTLQAASIALGAANANKTPYDPTKLEWDRADESCSETY